MPAKGDSDTSSVTRRKLMALSATGLGIGLSGCSSGSEGDGTTADSGDTGDSTTIDERVDRYFKEGNDGIDPTKVQFNQYNPQHYPAPAAPYLFDPLGVFSPVEDKFRGILAKDWEMDMDAATFTVTLRDQTWITGDPLTSEDVKTKLDLEGEFDASFWSMLEGVQTPDDSTVVLQLANNGNVNQELLMHQLFNFQFLISTPTSVFGEHLEALQNASSDSETDQARNDLNRFAWTEDVGTGPFVFESHGQEEWRLKLRREGHPIAEQMNFSGFAYRTVGTDRRIPAINNHEIDECNINATESKLAALDDHVQASRFPWFTGISLSFNFEREEFQDRAFRQAIAYLVNRKLAVRNVAPLSNHAHGKVHGMSGGRIGVPKTWLDDKWDAFESYGYDSSKTEEATQLLENAGYSKSNDQWNKPNGEPIQPIEMVGPGPWSWIRMVETAAEGLRNFGIPTEVRGEDPSVMMGDTWQQSNFDIVTGEIGGFLPYPPLQFGKLFARSLGYDQYRNPVTNMPLEFEVPMPVGDPSGSTQTVNIQENLEEVGTIDPDEARGKIQEVAWAVNQAVPVLPVYDKIGYKAWDTSEWTIPPEEDPLMQITYPGNALMNLDNGLQAKPE